jgi:hypothetical protein
VLYKDREESTIRAMANVVREYTDEQGVIVVEYDSGMTKNKANGHIIRPKPVISSENAHAMHVRPRPSGPCARP